jgi:hypothetical protein
MARIGSAKFGSQNLNSTEDGASRLAQWEVAQVSKPVRSVPRSSVPPEPKAVKSSVPTAPRGEIVTGSVAGPGRIAAKALAVVSMFFRKPGSAPGSAPKLEPMAGRVVRYMEGRPGAYPNAFDGLKGNDYKAMARALDEVSTAMVSPKNCSPMSKLQAQMNSFRNGELTMSELLSNASKSPAKGDLPWVVNQLRGANRFKLSEPPPADGWSLGNTGPRNMRLGPMDDSLPVQQQPLQPMLKPVKPDSTRAPLPQPGENSSLFPKWMRGDPPKGPPK